MSTNAKPLTSPVGHYRPELLVLAPESGEDGYTKSLVAQLIELGVAIELDENWRLPTEPPKDLSAYRMCLFPETARERYDHDLDAFYRSGGFLLDRKYYPVASSVPRRAQHEHGQISTYGRDAYCYHLANKAIEGDLTVGHPDFARTLEKRSVPSIVAECRHGFFAQHGDRSRGRWEKWGDTGFTQLTANVHLTEQTGDAEWLNLTDYWIDSAAAVTEEALAGAFAHTRQLPETTTVSQPMIATLLLDRGVNAGRPALVEAGVKLMRRFLETSLVVDGVVQAKYMRFFWGESMLPAMGLYWLARVTSDPKVQQLADTLVRTVAARNRRPDGLWHHWSDNHGGRGVCWSRGTYWALLTITQSLRAVDRSSPSAALLQDEQVRIYDGLRGAQDPDRGMWRLVLDEPQTRVESSATAGMIYCHDQLRQLGVVSGSDDAMFERAFVGLKRLFYGGGLAAACRGTGVGTPEYYRTRPMGFFDAGLFPATLAGRGTEKGDDKGHITGITNTNLI